MSDDPTLILGYHHEKRELKVARLKLKVTPQGEAANLLSFSQGVVRTGKDPSNHLVLEDAAVSRFHCLFLFRQGSFYVQDLRSSNGTVLNGHSVTEGALRPGDKLVLGRTLVEILKTECRNAIEAREGKEFRGMIAADKEMRSIFSLIERVAPTDAVISITGESGTGKELVARALHDLSHRNKGPFVAVNCTAINPNLVESELFGHERGSFTGADRRHAGAIEQARGGTIFLDEIGDMPEKLQPVLLRFLENGTYRRVGGLLEEKSDVRVITATNKDLKELVAKGQFREDLYYRLNVISIRLPPLRERPGDIDLLAKHLLKKLVKGERRLSLGEEAVRKLRRYGWPGNIRELRNTIQRVVALTPGHQEIILPQDLDLEIPQLPLFQSERETIQHAIQQGGSIRKAARLLGVNKSFIERRMRKFG